MDTLFSGPVGQVAKILSVEADDDIKHRLFSFGINRGAKIKVKTVSINKATIEVEIGSTLVALRNDEAKKIKVDSL